MLDLPGGHQPILTDDAQFVIVFNGEIYNHRELRAELQERVTNFRAIIPILRLSCSVTGMGIKIARASQWHVGPMRFTIARAASFLQPGSVWQEAILFTPARASGFGLRFRADFAGGASRRRRTVSRPAAPKIFCLWLHSCAPIHFGWSFQTSGRLFASSRCPVAGLSAWKNTDLVLEPFERLPRIQRKNGEQLRELLDRAVHRRLLADVPVGVFLSGGSTRRRSPRLPRAMFPWGS